MIPSSTRAVHGPMWDLGRGQEFDQASEILLPGGPAKTFAVVCHSTGALSHVKPLDGKLLVDGKTVTGFTNGEEGSGRD